MIRLIALFCLLPFLSGLVAAKELTDAEKKALVQRAGDFEKAMQKQQTETLLAMLHPGIYPTVGGKENFVTQFSLMLDSIRENVAAGEISFGLSKLGAPSEIHMNGGEEVCFIPKTTELTLGGEKQQLKGVLIAARGKHGKEWLFVDGGEKMKEAGSLWEIFPGLPKDVRMPVSK